MGRIVVGVFERSIDAQRACFELLATGFRGVEMQARSHAPADDVADAVRRAMSGEEAAGACRGSGSSARREQRCVVAVHAPRADDIVHAEDALQRCGAVDVRRLRFVIA